VRHSAARGGGDPASPPHAKKRKYVKRAPATKDSAARVINRTPESWAASRASVWTASRRTTWVRVFRLSCSAVCVCVCVPRNWLSPDTPPALLPLAIPVPQGASEKFTLGKGDLGGAKALEVLEKDDTIPLFITKSGPSPAVWVLTNAASKEYAKLVGQAHIEVGRRWITSWRGRKSTNAYDARERVKASGAAAAAPAPAPAALQQSSYKDVAPHAVGVEVSGIGRVQVLGVGKLAGPWADKCLAAPRAPLFFATPGFEPTYWALTEAASLTYTELLKERHIEVARAWLRGASTTKAYAVFIVDKRGRGALQDSACKYLTSEHGAANERARLEAMSAAQKAQRAALRAASIAADPEIHQRLLSPKSRTNLAHLFIQAPWLQRYIRPDLWGSKTYGPSFKAFVVAIPASATAAEADRAFRIEGAASFSTDPPVMSDADGSNLTLTKLEGPDFGFEAIMLAISFVPGQVDGADGAEGQIAKFGQGMALGRILQRRWHQPGCKVRPGLAYVLGVFSSIKGLDLFGERVRINETHNPLKDKARAAGAPQLASYDTLLAHHNMGDRAAQVTSNLTGVPNMALWREARVLRLEQRAAHVAKLVGGEAAYARLGAAYVAKLVIPPCVSEGIVWTGAVVQMTTMRDADGKAQLEATLRELRIELVDGCALRTRTTVLIYGSSADLCNVKAQGAVVRGALVMSASEARAALGAESARRRAERDSGGACA
jgi:hypothetical protein